MPHEAPEECNAKDGVVGKGGRGYRADLGRPRSAVGAGHLAPAPSPTAAEAHEAPYLGATATSRPSPTSTFLAYGGANRIVPPGQSQLLGERLLEAGVPHRLVELPWAKHTFDFLWGEWGSQITRYSLEVFLESNLKTPAEEAKTPGAFEHRFNAQRHEGDHSEKNANF